MIRHLGYLVFKLYFPKRHFKFKVFTLPFRPNHLAALASVSKANPNAIFIPRKLPGAVASMISPSSGTKQVALEHPLQQSNTNDGVVIPSQNHSTSQQVASGINGIGLVACQMAEPRQELQRQQILEENPPTSSACGLELLAETATAVEPPTDPHEVRSGNEAHQMVQINITLIIEVASGNCGRELIRGG